MSPEECGLCGQTGEDHECTGRPECDCCQACFSDGETSYSCSFYPEYNCGGACEHRGQPGHYRVKPAGDPHPSLSWPERVCSGPCCRPAEARHA